MTFHVGAAAEGEGNVVEGGGHSDLSGGPLATDFTLERKPVASSPGRCAREETNELRELLRVERSRLAKSLQREEVLLQRLTVVEEGRVLYQVYVERLLELLRTDAGAAAVAGGDRPLVTREDLLEGLRDALRSIGAVATETVIGNAHEGACVGATVSNESREEPGRACVDRRNVGVGGQAPPVSLSNATLLTASTLEMRLAAALELRERERSRKHGCVMHHITDSLEACKGTMEARFAAIVSALHSVEQRVDGCSREVSVLLKNAGESKNDQVKRLERVKEEFLELNNKHLRVLQELRGSQLEVAALRDDVVRAEARVTSLLSLNKAADCLGDALQDIRELIRSTANDILQRARKGTAIREPFVQSMHLVALKIAAQAEALKSDSCQRCSRYQLARSAGVPPPIPTFCLDDDEICRLVALPTEGSSDGQHDQRSNGEHSKHLQPSPGAVEVLSKSKAAAVILEELGRVMNNFCRILENSMRQSLTNTVSITQAINRLEAAVMGKLTDLQGSTEQSLMCCGPTSSPAAPGSTPSTTVKRGMFTTHIETYCSNRGGTNAAVKLPVTPSKPAEAPAAVAAGVGACAGPARLITSLDCMPPPPQRRLVLQERDSFGGTPPFHAAVVR